VAVILIGRSLLTGETFEFVVDHTDWMALNARDKTASPAEHDRIQFELDQIKAESIKKIRVIPTEDKDA